MRLSGFAAMQLMGQATPGMTNPNEGVTGATAIQLATSPVAWGVGPDGSPVALYDASTLAPSASSTPAASSAAAAPAAAPTTGVIGTGTPWVQSSAQSTSPTTGQPSAVTYASNQPWFPWVVGGIVGLLLGYVLGAD